MNFPSSPTIGEIYTYASQSWKWSGTTWDRVTSVLETQVAILKSTSFSLSFSDQSKVIQCSSASNITITIPTNALIPFEKGIEFAIVRYGTGEVIFSPSGGVILNSSESLRAINGQYEAATLKKIDTDEWLLLGSLS